MKNIKKNSSGEKIKFFAHPITDYILILVMWGMGNFGLIKHIIDKFAENITPTEELMGALAFNIIFFFIMVTTFGSYIIVDLREETLTFNQTGFKKTKLSLNDIAGIALTIRDNNEIMITICKTNRVIYSMYGWSIGAKGMGPTFTESAQKRKMRYEKFADQVNAIIRERYPDNKPINYDESDE